MEMESYPQTLVIVTSDEENKFPISELYHPDMKVWSSYPVSRDLDGYWPIGYRSDTKKLIKTYGLPEKTLDWFFAGQSNHQSRWECVAALKDLPNGFLEVSDGFGQGLSYDTYIKYMTLAKVVPCPMGSVSPDSFRLYEALESGCIPIVENREFWTMMFGEVPFPIVENWLGLKDMIEYYKDRPDVNNKCQVWWLEKKKELQWALQLS